MTNDETELDRLCRRFEIAVGNFGRSCLSLRANEKAFQAWYAACVIQEFGLSRVYREIHLKKEELFAFAGDHELTAGLREGNELFPDLSVSWLPDVDARHSNTRSTHCKEAGAMLQQFAVLSELKVTGSTGTPTSRLAIKQDLAKLAVFAHAHKTSCTEGIRPLATYMVVLDNHGDDSGNPSPRYSTGRLTETLEEVNSIWPESARKPVVMLLYLNGQESVIQTYRDFKLDVRSPVGA